MSALAKEATRIVIACGGTGGHFFPGMAVGQELVSRGNQVMLIASRKDVDRENAKGLDGYRIEFLPAVALRTPVKFQLFFVFLFFQVFWASLGPSGVPSGRRSQKEAKTNFGYHFGDTLGPGTHQHSYFEPFRGPKASQKGANGTTLRADSVDKWESENDVHACTREASDGRLWAQSFLECILE